MLEYVKTILKKVSFDESLFEKELKKAQYWLNKRERAYLKEWIKEEFAVVYEEEYQEM
jgi:hypothetical protein